MQRATPAGSEVGHRAERLEHVGRTDRRRRRPAPVLAHLGPRRRHHQRGDGRHVDRPQPVAAGAAGVDHVGAGRQGQGHGVGDHGPDEPGHLGDGLALGAQGHGQAGDLGRRGLARQHLGRAPTRPRRPTATRRRAAASARRASRPARRRCPGPARRLALAAGGHGAQSHHRSWSSTPRPMSPSCTWDVPSTIVSWRGVPVPELGRVVLHVPGRPEQLHGQARGPHGQLGGVVLGHRQVGHVLLGELALVGQPRRAVGEEPGRLDVHGHLGDLPLDALEVGDGLAERLALLARTRWRT